MVGVLPYSLAGGCAAGFAKVLPRLEFQPTLVSGPWESLHEHEWRLEFEPKFYPLLDKILEILCPYTRPKMFNYS